MLRQRIFYIALSLLLLFGSTGLAQEVFSKVDDPSDLQKEIKQANKEIESLQTPFTQKKMLSFMNEEVISKGMFYFEKKKKLRWEYTSPFSYIIVINGHHITINDEGNIKTFDASTNPMFSEINKIMMGIVSGELLENNKFEVEYFLSDASIRLLLSPKDAGIGGFISQIQMDMDPETKLVHQIKMIEATGDYTLIRFTEKTTNAEIPEDMFRLD